VAHVHFFGPDIREIVPPAGASLSAVPLAHVVSFETHLGQQHPDAPQAVPAAAAAAFVDEDASATPLNALDTLGGATSKDVARGLGHPGGGVSKQRGEAIPEMLAERLESDQIRASSRSSSELVPENTRRKPFTVCFPFELLAVLYVVCLYNYKWRCK
jgi:hypothetical protein